jgi:hypothetical protein
VGEPVPRILLGATGRLHDAVQHDLGDCNDLSHHLFLGLKNACDKETLRECAEALSEDMLRGNGIGPVTIAEFKRLCYKAHILGA